MGSAGDLAAAPEVFADLRRALDQLRADLLDFLETGAVARLPGAGRSSRSSGINGRRRRSSAGPGRAGQEGVDRRASRPYPPRRLPGPSLRRRRRGSARAIRAVSAGPSCSATASRSRACGSTRAASSPAARGAAARSGTGRPGCRSDPTGAARRAPRTCRRTGSAPAAAPRRAAPRTSRATGGIIPGS